MSECEVCNQLVINGLCAVRPLVFCFGCQTKISGCFHYHCITKREECSTCCKCTLDKTKMRVTILNKLQYLIKHYKISTNEFKKLTTELNLDLIVCSYTNIMNDDYIIQNHEVFASDAMYTVLINKYQLTDEIIEEKIKEEWQKRRSGYFVKPARKMI